MAKSFFDLERDLGNKEMALMLAKGNNLGADVYSNLEADIEEARRALEEKKRAFYN